MKNADRLRDTQEEVVFRWNAPRRRRRVTRGRQPEPRSGLKRSRYDGSEYRPYATIEKRPVAFGYGRAVSMKPPLMQTGYGRAGCPQPAAYTGVRNWAKRSCGVARALRTSIPSAGVVAAQVSPNSAYAEGICVPNRLPGFALSTKHSALPIAAIGDGTAAHVLATRRHRPRVRACRPVPGCSGSCRQIPCCEGAGRRAGKRSLGRLSQKQLSG